MAVRKSAVEAARALAEVASTWVALGAGDPTRSGHTGSFAGFGPDLVVSLGPLAGEASTDMPLPLLVAGWLRGQAEPDRITVSPELIAPGTSRAGCTSCGRELAGRLRGRSGGDPVGLLVLGDGSAKHGTAAPGYADDRAPAFESVLAAALATADLDALDALDPRLCTELAVSGREPWQAAAAVAREAGAWRAETMYFGTPLGVGYHVVVWDRR